MINNERQIRQPLTQEVTQQLFVSRKMNGQSMAPMRHQTRHEASQTKNPFTVVAHEGYGPEERKTELVCSLGHEIGRGAFGRVYSGTLPHLNNQLVAIKQVLQDKRYRNRELPLMRSLKHCNIVTLLYYFFQEVNRPNQKADTVLNLVMEYIPDSVSALTSKSKQRLGVPMLTIKLCMYQIFRALSYIHTKGICHRDIKPNNLLFDSKTGVLKICDFGSAKTLINGVPNVSYICARYYRAPELLFGATDYTNMIDIWSVGVVFTELLLGEPLFHGDSGIDQLVLIISKLGTPTKEEVTELNHNYVKYDFPQINPRPLQMLFPKTPSEAIDLMSKIFEYRPSQRIGPLQACAHPFFDELREPGKKYCPDSSFLQPRAPIRDLPPLFNFTAEELKHQPSLGSTLIPNHYQRLIGDGSNSSGLMSTLTHV